MPSFS
jgi:hypothetical protein